MTKKSLELIRTRALIGKLIEQVADPKDKADFLAALQNPDISDSIELLNELKGIVNAASPEVAAVEEKVFASKSEAMEFLSSTVFPMISSHFRLFKTSKLRQDEYIVINRDWLDDARIYDTYASPFDVADRLASIGIPSTVHYFTQSSGGKSSVQKLNVLSMWRRDPQTQSGRLSTLQYIPGASDIVGYAFNTFKDVSVTAVPDVDLSIFLGHMQDNLCNGNTLHYEYLLNWLAHLVQHPSKRPMTAVSIIGGQGTGKGIFIDFISRMLGGRRNCNTTTSPQDTKNFNTAIAGKLFVVFDEATFSGDHQQSDFMKKLVTEPYVRIEPKGIDAYEVENYVRCFITSNNMESAVPATIGARRWLIIECK
ncbi:primase-helicase family protein [Paucibacter sp. KCTC 42545]|uniref:primase-helicase family protein n=1 Tax=Paucibacter sp. KCTC 42545 TaxID=1768242 RepID=UPI000733AC89|nr:primase-helicase family protein [Paucibacter sp. KCTC 42545]ALT76991.1 hypothetical protein AT984_07085 [Paucibacter sp. KCTC 42545]